MSESLRVSGKKAALPAAEPGWRLEARPGGWVIATRARADGSMERHRFMAIEARGKLSAALGGRLWNGELIQAARGGAGGGGTDADLVAQFPGKVRKILVSAGQKVEEGDPLLLVEAMKMEFQVKAPAAGTVKLLRVKEGQQLQPGDRFLDLDA